MAHAPLPRLSICMATYGRGAFIAQTLDSLLTQLSPDVELVIVNGASPDDTDHVVRSYIDRFPNIRYILESANSGVDRDYDKAVNYARGEFCWLMTDDDLLVPDAIARVLLNLSADLDLLIANASLSDSTFSTVLRPRYLSLGADQVYQSGDEERFLAETASYISFIGSVIVRRTWWMERDRSQYFGTLFVHVGVIFQQPSASRVRVIADPLIQIRYGNAMWSARTFEIWMIKWPALIWSFSHISMNARAQVCPRDPWRRWRKLGVYRAIGAYSIAEYSTFVRPRLRYFSRAAPFLIAIFPPRVANFIAAIYCLLINRNRMTAYDLARSTNSTSASRFVARHLGH